LHVPFPAGSNVTIFVIEESEDFKYLLAASESSLDFWDNVFDDEDWNDVGTRGYSINSYCTL